MIFVKRHGGYLFWKAAGAKLSIPGLLAGKAADHAQMNLIAASIPLFFILIGIEMVAARVLERRVYRFADSFADLGCGMIEQLLGALVKATLFAAYLGLFARARLFDLPKDSWVVFSVCFIAVDFLYYWFHRTSHEAGALWAAHSVHHQSEEYNLSVALRQGAFQSFFSWVFYLPLAVLGFAPITFITCSALNTLYQFWIHTRLIGKMGPIEWIFNTPSHHRVHHGRNPRYIDRNHAGVFIIWDRWFGTFVPETEEPLYGVVKPVRSANPLWANFAGWVDLWAVARQATGVGDRLKPLVAPPGWRPEAQGGPLVPPEIRRPEDETVHAPTSLVLASYVFANFVLLLVLTGSALARVSLLGEPTLLALAVFVTLNLVVLAALLEERRWAAVLETGRVLALVVLGSVYGPHLFPLLFGKTWDLAEVHSRGAGETADHYPGGPDDVFVDTVPAHELSDHHPVLGRILDILHLDGLAGIGIVGQTQGANAVEAAVLENLHHLIADQDETFHQAVAGRPGRAGVESAVEVVEDLDIAAVDGFPLDLHLPGRRPLVPGQRRPYVLGRRPVLFLQIKKPGAQGLVFSAQGAVGVHGLLQLRLRQAGSAFAFIESGRGFPSRGRRGWIIFGHGDLPLEVIPERGSYRPRSSRWF